MANYGYAKPVSRPAAGASSYRLQDEDAAALAGGGFRWESQFERSWEALSEDADGLLASSVARLEQQRKRRQRLAAADHKGSSKLGMMRHLVLGLDCSETSGLPDLKPCRLAACLAAMRAFVSGYFDQNPIGQLGIVMTRRKLAERVTELAGNPRRHLDALRELEAPGPRAARPDGEASFQNLLDLVLQALGPLPGYASKEAVLLVSALSTCDPSDIAATIEQLAKAKIRCSVIALSAEIRVLRRLAEATGGSYSVPLDAVHLHDALSAFLAPPPSAAGASEAALIRMGFPHSERPARHPQLCACHCAVLPPGAPRHACPQCRSVYCELPTDCRVCGLSLASAAHLARSYQHLFPLKPFAEVTLAGGTSCRGCALGLPVNSEAYQCGQCRACFCIDCDRLLHDSLHSCPVCLHAVRAQ